MDGAPVSVQLLAAKGAIVNTRDNEGKTPLMWAVENALHSDFRVASVRTLLESGADVTIRDNKGVSALDIARSLPNLRLEQIIANSTGKR